MKIISFDLETLKRAPDEPDASYDLGVTCIGVVLSDDERPKVWHPPYDLVDARYGQRMSVGQIEDFVQYLVFMCRTEDYMLLGANILGFDLRILAESGVSHEMYQDLRELALESIDPSFQFFCEQGWMVGLQAFAEGMDVLGKTVGMDGLKAMKIWRDGDGDDQRMVLDYVVQDAQAALDVYQAMIETGAPRFMTKTTRRRKPWNCHWWTGGAYPVMRFDSRENRLRIVEHSDYRTILDFENRRLLTCREALKLPVPPPPTWLKDPWDRAKFAGWTGMV